MKVNYVNKTFGQRFPDYLGPDRFNKLDLVTEKKNKNVSSKSSAKQYKKKKKMTFIKFRN